MKKINILLFENMSKEEFIKIISGGLNEENSFVVIKDNKILAYIINYDSEEKSLAIGYLGNHINNIEIYKEFLYSALINLFKKYEILELEIDHCDKDAMIL
ncbi:hypothetical protein [Clostridium cadaveris]|uniref:hypothetical protein n=1 Tax=Clostridium cadaveris TaxID=1529 RepID=UPI0012DE0525|nr:hypothetical protein [Clostridium cadaveris]NWK09780.1 hypothetical protein [Clostridium cadaveris]